MNWLIIPIPKEFVSGESKHITMTDIMVEKLTFYIASVDQDIFYISIKGISTGDSELWLVDSESRIEDRIAESFYNVLGMLVQEISGGCFDKGGFGDPTKMVTDIMKCID
jgi:hypothetical protein